MFFAVCPFIYAFIVQMLPYFCALYLFILTYAYYFCLSFFIFAIIFIYLSSVTFRICSAYVCIYFFLCLLSPLSLCCFLAQVCSRSTSHSLPARKTSALMRCRYASTQLLHLTHTPCNLSSNFLSPFIESLIRTAVRYIRETVSFLFELML